MKKNGFIATSLIYSFFLIFITLFLGIIADYLQNRVLLNETEASIKEDLNNIISVRDVSVGDYVAFMGTGCNNATPNEYVVANVIVNNETLCATAGSSNCLILYNLNVGDVTVSTTKTKLTYSNITSDIIQAYDNDTYKNKILYTFFGAEGVNYSLNDGKQVVTNGCTETDYYYTSNGCIKEGGSNSVYRERYVLPFDDNKNVCADLSGSGSFYFAS